MNHIRNIFIFSVIFSVFVISVYAFVFFMIRSGNMKISELRSDITTVLGREHQLRSSRDIVLDTELSRAELDSYLISKDGVVDFLESIESFADTARVPVEVRSVEIEPIPSSAAVHNLSVIIAVEGRWEDVFYFLDLLESQPLSISTSRMNLEKDKEGGVWRLTLDFKVLKIK